MYSNVKDKQDFYLFKISKNIQDAVKNNNIERFEFEMRRLNIDEITNFMLVSGFEVKNFKEAFKTAEISAQKVSLISRKSRLKLSIFTRFQMTKIHVHYQ